AEVQLVRPVEADAAVHEEARQHAVADRRADLALDVVADDRQALLGEAALPVGLATDEDRDRGDEADAGLEGLLDVPLRRFLAANRQVGDHDVDLALLEDADDVGRGPGRLLDDLAQVLAEAVVGHAPLDLDAEVLDLLADDRVVRLRVDRLGQVLADLVLVDVERGHELDVADVVAAAVDVHPPGGVFVALGVVVVVAALDQAALAVADAADRDADLPARLVAVRGAAGSVAAHLV